MESSRPPATILTWVAGALVLLGTAWALMQGFYTSAATSIAGGSELTHCGHETMLLGLTVAGGVLALAAFVFAIARAQALAIDDNIGMDISDATGDNG